MRASVQKWGNSLALRIPRTYAREAKVQKGSSVDIAFKSGKFILTPVFSPAYTLNKLLAGVNHKNIHKEQSSGQPRGLEAW